MKRLIFIGGPMGVGKTSTSKILQTKLNKCVYLDGDWCWFTNPWILNEETKAIALENITHNLNTFIKADSYENIVFSWILHENQIVSDILNKLDLDNVAFYNFSLIATKNAIIERLKEDLDNGIRSEEIVIERSLKRLEQVKMVDSVKIDTTSKTVIEVVDELIKYIEVEKK